MRGTNSLGKNEYFFVMVVIIVGCSVLACLYRVRPSHASESTKKLIITCAPDRPIARPGESITVRTWINGPMDIASENIKWKSSVGTIKGNRVATWSFPKDEKNLSSEVPAMAEAFVRHKSLGQLECQLRVYLVDVPLVRQGPNRHRLSGRTFLLPGKNEPERYGLYSYLLFGTPPSTNTERERYLRGIESYLLVVQPIEELEFYKDRSLLNITLIPLKVSIDIDQNLAQPEQARELAIKLLRIYDYGRAQILLSDLGLPTISSGPLLASKRTSTKGSNAIPLVLDMSHVDPDLVQDWIKTFCLLATQEPSWAQENLRRLALNMRNVIAVAGKEMPKVLAELDKWIRLFASQ